MTVSLEEGGSYYFIDGINAMYPSTIVAIAPIRLASYGYWKKIAKLTRASRKTGMKMVARELPGYL